MPSPLPAVPPPPPTPTHPHLLSYLFIYLFILLFLFSCCCILFFFTDQNLYPDQNYEIVYVLFSNLQKKVTLVSECWIHKYNSHMQGGKSYYTITDSYLHIGPTHKAIHSNSIKTRMISVVDDSFSHDTMP